LIIDYFDVTHDRLWMFKQTPPQLMADLSRAIN